MMVDPSAVYLGATELLALCTCTRQFVTVSPAAVKAGHVYCKRCAPTPAPATPATATRRP